MNAITILPEEIAELEGLRLEAQLIYLKVIVPNRDPETGLAVGRRSGVVYSISNPEMQRALVVDGKPGMKGQSTSKETVRRLLALLVREGLIEMAGKDISEGVLCKAYNKYKALNEIRWQT